MCLGRRQTPTMELFAQKQFMTSWLKAVKYFAKISITEILQGPKNTPANTTNRYPINRYPVYKRPG